MSLISSNAARPCDGLPHPHLPNASPERFSLSRHWSTQELVTIGVFAAVIKASTLLVAYLGGGMNPITLMAKNCIYTMLMIVLLHKVPRVGTLTLAAFVTAFVSLLFMGQGVLHTPGVLLASLFAELLVVVLGGYKKTTSIVIGVLVLEILSKIISLGISWLMMREQPGMLITVSLFITIGVIGTFVGLGLGVKFTKELRHAGIIPYS